MAKITLNVEDKNLEIVMTILNNLKDGLIKNIENSSNSNTIPSRTNKYMSKDEYKKRLTKGK